MTLVIVAAAGVAFAIWCIQTTIHHSPTQPAEPSNLDHHDGHGDHCTVPFCDNPITIRLNVAHDYWPFCLNHGLPYLTEGLRDKEDAS